jgi:hypothetical protein
VNHRKAILVHIFFTQKEEHRAGQVKKWSFRIKTTKYERRLNKTTKYKVQSTYKRRLNKEQQEMKPNIQQLYFFL